MNELTRNMIESLLDVEELDKTFMDWYLKSRLPMDRASIKIDTPAIGILCITYKLHLEVLKLTNEINKLKPKADIKPIEPETISLQPFPKLERAVNWEKIPAETLVHCQLTKDADWQEGKFLLVCTGNKNNKCMVHIEGTGDKTILKKNIRLSSDTLELIK